MFDVGEGDSEWRFSLLSVLFLFIFSAFLGPCSVPAMLFTLDNNRHDNAHLYLPERWFHSILEII
jgi:hypothetical protein